MTTEANAALEALVSWSGELDDLVRAANRADPPASAVLDRAAVEAVLVRAVGGGVTAEELTGWAQAVHLHDGVEIEDGHEDLLTQFLFEASTPEIVEPVTLEFCRRWLARIGAAR
ncbi:hypothetical protein ACWEQL_17340 [Kitasatospora sp. NPDC004240]